MTVAREFIDVIIPIRHIERVHPGGPVGYCGNHRAAFGGRLWHDGVILRDDAMGSQDIKSLVEECEPLGLASMADVGGRTVWNEPCAVTSPPCRPTAWCEWLRMRPERSGVYHTGHEDAPSVNRHVMRELRPLGSTGAPVVNAFKDGSTTR